MHMPLDPDSPIGVYDSGVGGLSVLKVLQQQLPHETFLYVADCNHAPYGDRDEAFLETRASAIAQFMLDQRAKAIVLACNTITVVAVHTLREQLAIPVVAMEPAIKPAAAISHAGRVLVLATKATIASKSVERLCNLVSPETQVILQACPGLVQQVERGAIGDQATRQMLEDYLRPGLEAGADAIVLGCTHYHLLAHEIAQLAGPHVTIIEPSQAIARQLIRVLSDRNALTSSSSNGQLSYFTSGPVGEFRSLLDIFGEESQQVFPLPV